MARGQERTVSIEDDCRNKKHGRRMLKDGCDMLLMRVCDKESKHIAHFREDTMDTDMKDKDAVDQQRRRTRMRRGRRKYTRR